MPVDEKSQEIQFLVRQFEKANVVLFAGAGYSLGARSKKNSDPPLGTELSMLLAKECGWDYSGEELPVVYEQAERHLGTSGIRDFLDQFYSGCRPAPWHQAVSKLYWYRIYTTNIDDVVENSYRQGFFQELRSIVSPAPFGEPDHWFKSVQCVHLHGYAPDRSKPLTFTFQDFAKQTATPNPWYQALVDDMQSKSVIFIGTRLSESPFHHYIALRSERTPGTKELRAKAYFVSPGLSAIRRRQLRDQDIVVIDASAEEFFAAVTPLVTAKIASVGDIWRNRYPHEIGAINAGLIDQQAELLRQFDFVTARDSDSKPNLLASQAFYQGSEPTWDDIRNGVDASRECTAGFFDVVQRDKEDINSFVITGHAGMGKSTVLRRLAFELARAGETVYFCKSPESVEKKPIVNLLSSLGNRHVFLVLDDAVAHVSRVDELVSGLQSGINATFIFADRPHIILPRLNGLGTLEPTILEMPVLNRPDCERIIDKLNQFGLLGELQNKPRSAQLQEFLGRSRKQLLVAMKEATLGRGFDEILAHEYQTLASDTARLAYTITCAAFMHRAPVRRRHLLASVGGSDLQLAKLLAEDLKDVVVPWRENPELLCPRHPVIAAHVMQEAASFEMKRDAVLSFLTQISAEITPQNIAKRTPEYIAYRGIINFDNLAELFGDNYDVIHGMFAELRQYYSDGFLFYLQFGRAEIHFNHFDTAENYLKQSLAIRSAQEGNYQAINQLGILFLKRARFQDDSSLARADLKQGEEILMQQIKDRGQFDAYGAVALISYKLRFIREHYMENVAEQLKELMAICKKASEQHPFEDSLKELQVDLQREYLMTTVSRRQREKT